MKRTFLAGVLLVSVSIVAISVALLWVFSGPRAIAGADSFADNRGEVELSDIFANFQSGRTDTQEFADGPPALQDLRIAASSVLVPGEDKSFWLLTDLDFTLTKVDITGEILDIISPQLNQEGTLAVAVDQDGAAIRSHMVVKADDPEGRAGHSSRSASYFPRFNHGSAGFTVDGGMLFGDREAPRIDHYITDVDLRTWERESLDEPRPDTEIVRILGPAGDTEGAVADESLGPIVALRALEGDRVVFVSDTTEGRRLFLLEDDEVRQIAPDVPDLVHTTRTEQPPVGLRGDRRALDPINLTADGRLTTIGENPDGDPVIRLVDLDTDEVQVLAELDGVDPSYAEPVSAVLIEDDLIFLAEDTLWKLEHATG